MDSLVLQEKLGFDISLILPRAMKDLTHPRREGSLEKMIPTWCEALLGRHPRLSKHAAGCVRAGLLLLADDMDGAHTICQDIPTALGSGWHAHLHRREPDFFNANYWWRRAGGLGWTLPGAMLADEVRAKLAGTDEGAAWEGKLRKSNYNPADFVAAVEKATEGKAPETWLNVLRDVQRLEWLSLLWMSLESG